MYSNLNLSISRDLWQVTDEVGQVLHIVNPKTLDNVIINKFPHEANIQQKINFTNYFTFYFSKYPMGKDGEHVWE